MFAFAARAAVAAAFAVCGGYVFSIDACRFFTFHRARIAAARATITCRSIRRARRFHRAGIAFAAAIVFVAARRFGLTVGGLRVHTLHRARISRRFTQTVLLIESKNRNRQC